MAVRRPRPASTWERARHLVGKWRRDLSWHERWQTIRQTKWKPHYRQLTETDASPPSERYFIRVMHGGAVSRLPHAFDFSSRHLSWASCLPSHWINLHPGFGDTQRLWSEELGSELKVFSVKTFHTYLLISVEDDFQEKPQKKRLTSPQLCTSSCSIDFF